MRNSDSQITLHNTLPVADYFLFDTTDYRTTVAPDKNSTGNCLRAMIRDILSSLAEVLARGMKTISGG